MTPSTLSSRSTSSMTRRLIQAAGGVALAGALFAATPARAQVVVEFPTPEIIATTPPVYYEGRAHYWYGGHWYYRDGGAWRHYDNEPVFLHDYRGHHDFDRHYYEGHRGWGDRGRGWDHGRRR